MSSARGIPHWAQIEEATFAAGMWLLYRVYCSLGRSPFLLMLYPVVLFYWVARTQARRSSRQYLRQIERRYGAIGTAPRWRHELRHFLRFAETILDKMLVFGGRYPFERVQFEGLEPIVQMVREGRGGVLVTGHVGCLELCEAAAERQPGMKLNVLVHTRNAERFNRLLKKLNPRTGVRLLQVTEVTAATAIDLSTRVARGEFVAIAGDRVPVTASKTAQVEFLGAAADLPVGAYALAALLGCPVYFMGCIRRSGGYVVRFDRLAERIELPRSRREDALRQCAQQFAQWLEVLLQQAPYDWFNFFPFWDQGRAVSRDAPPYRGNART